MKLRDPILGTTGSDSGAGPLKVFAFFLYVGVGLSPIWTKLQNNTNGILLPRVAAAGEGSYDAPNAGLHTGLTH